MNATKQQFIRTNDPHTIQILKEMGFTQINGGSDTVTFLNNTSFSFDKLDLQNMKMSFSNVLFV